jgi:hypothetical protein
MASAILETFKTVPPLQDALVQTGDFSLRRVSKDFKSVFDVGVYRAWVNLKHQANTDLKFLSVFMNNIEQLNGGVLTQDNSVSFFKRLKDSLKVHRAVKGLVYLSPFDKLPINIACFQLLGPKYIKDEIPEEIQKTAVKIDKLKMALDNIPFFLSFVPKEFKCAATEMIMRIPVVDSSHSSIQDLCNQVKDNILTAETDCSLFHALENKTMDIHANSAIFAQPKCPCCTHLFKQDSLRISAKLQDEILHFLEDSGCSILL